MAIMITGANGYLGKTLVSHFQREKTDVLELVRKPESGKISCDLTDKKQVTDLFACTPVDLIIHCAAFVPQSLADYQKSTLSADNTMMLDNIIGATACPILYVSSMTVYGHSSTVVRREDDAGTPLSEYGRSKYDGEMLLKNSGRDSLAIRIPGLFGGNRHSGLIANVVASLKNAETPSLPQYPLLWAAMDVRDAAQIIYSLSQVEFTGFNPINVAYADVYSVNNLLSYCNDYFNTAVDCAVDHPEFAFDLSLLASFGIRLENTLQSALNRYMASSS